MIDDRQRRERIGLAVGLIGVAVFGYGLFALGSDFGVSFGFGNALKPPSILLSIVLTVGGLGVFLLGKRIATNNGEYESYWFG